MPISIIKLQEYFDHADFEKGTDLFRDSGVVDLKQAEKNLWLGTVKQNDKSFEVEVLLTGNKVKEHQCSCVKMRECVHSIAVFQAIKESKAAARKRGRTTSNKVKRMTTASLLKSVSPADLELFVKDYARKNRQFSLALKTRFASRVDIGDTKEKYAQLLDAIIKSSVRRNGTMTYKGYQKLIKSTKELSVQVEKNLLEQYYQESFGGVQAILEKVIPLFRKTDDSKGEIKANIEHAFSMLKHLLEAELPPDFKEEVRRFLLDNCTKIQYDIYAYYKKMFNLLFSMKNEGLHWNNLIDKIDEKLLQRGLADHSIAFLINMKSQVLQTLGFGADAEALFLKNMANPEVLKLAIHQSLQQDKLEMVEQMLATTIAKRYPRKMELEFESFRLQLALKKGDKETIITKAKIMLLSSFDLEYYNILKENCTKKEWAAIYPNLVNRFLGMPFSMELREVLPQLFAQEEDWKGMLSYIKNIRSLALLQEYDQLLLKHDRAAVLGLYEDMVKNFVRYHLGKENASKVRDLLFRLRQIGAKKLANSLLASIKKDYPNRKTLIEELSWI